MKISSKHKWYQHEEIPTKFFLNLEKQKAVSTTVGHFFNYLLLVKNLINTFKVFSIFGGLKTNFFKCGFTWLGLKSINLTIDTIKVLGVHFS